MGCASLQGPQEKSSLVGIARMAAESPLVRERAEVEYFPPGIAFDLEP